MARGVWSTWQAVDVQGDGEIVIVLEQADERQLLALVPSGEHGGERAFVDRRGARVELQCLVRGAAGPCDERLVLERQRHVGVVGPERLLPCGEGAREERLGGAWISLLQEEHGQIVEAHGHVRMVRAERLLPDGEGAREERLGGGVVTLHLEEVGQVVERHRDVGVLGAQRPFPDGEGATEERFGSSEVVLVPEERREVVEAKRDAGMIWASRLLVNGERTPEARLGREHSHPCP